MMLSDFKCQGIQFLKMDIFVVALFEVLYMSQFLYLHNPLFSLMYIHTRTYWNVFMKHLHDSVLWFIFIYPFALFVCSLFVCKGDGYLSVCWYWFIISIVILGRGLSKFQFRGLNSTKVWGLWLDLLSRNQGLVALSVTPTTAVYIYVIGVGLCTWKLRTPALFLHSGVLK